MWPILCQTDVNWAEVPWIQLSQLAFNWQIDFEGHEAPRSAERKLFPQILYYVIMINECCARQVGGIRMDHHRYIGVYLRMCTRCCCLMDGAGRSIRSNCSSSLRMCCVPMIYVGRNSPFIVTTTNLISSIEVTMRRGRRTVKCYLYPFRIKSTFSMWAHMWEICAPEI